jgi:hypothetical protein
MTIITIHIMTHSIGDTGGDMDGHGDLGILGMDLYGDGRHHIIGIIGDADRFGVVVFTDTIISHLTNITKGGHLQTDLVLAKESVQASAQEGHLLDVKTSWRHAILHGDETMLILKTEIALLPKLLAEQIPKDRKVHILVTSVLVQMKQTLTEDKVLHVHNAVLNTHVQAVHDTERRKTNLQNKKQIQE